MNEQIDLTKTILGIEFTLKEQNRVLDEIKLDGKETKKQAQTTNGRVGKLENWRSFITGGLTILTLMVVPIVIYILIHFPR